MSNLVDLIGHVHFPNLSFDVRQNCGRLFSYMCAYVTTTTGKNSNSSRKENVSANLKKAIKDATDESHNFHQESDDHTRVC